MSLPLPRVRTWVVFSCRELYASTPSIGHLLRVYLFCFVRACAPARPGGGTVVEGPVLGAPQKEAARGGVLGGAPLVGEAAEVLRTDHPGAHAQLVAGRPVDPVQHAAATGEDQARLEAVHLAGGDDLLLDGLEELVEGGRRVSWVPWVGG